MIYIEQFGENIKYFNFYNKTSSVVLHYKAQTWPTFDILSENKC